MKYTEVEAINIQIEKNRKFINEVEHLIDLKHDLLERLELISFVGALYSEFISGIYASQSLEQKIAETSNCLSEADPLEKKVKNKVLIVMSEAGDIGGHTVLVHNWVRWDEKREYSLVLTNQKMNAIPQFFKQAITDSNGDFYELKGNMLQKAEKLLRISQKYERILLFTHMQDILPVLVYSHKDCKVPVYFYNHADYRFSYGFTIADVVLNLNPYDEKKCIHARGSERENTVTLQFPGMGVIDRSEKKIAKKKERKRIAELYNAVGKKIVVSMGADWKYGNVNGYKFDDFAHVLSLETECVFLIIGANPSNEIWNKVYKASNGRVQAMGELKRDFAEQIIAVADLFIVSFPMASSGRYWAEKYQVPWLGLDITGRMGNGVDQRFAKTIEELIKKSRAVLLEGEVFSGQNIKLTKQEWLERWDKIYKQYTEHSVHEIYPVQDIGVQEYVNYQLLQQNAEKKLQSMIASTRLSAETYENIDSILKKYQLEPISMYQRMTQERREKLYYKNVAEVFEKILLIRQKNINVKKYFIQKRLYVVALYGMGRLGQMLLNEYADIINFIIDIRAEALRTSCRSYGPNDTFPKPQLIINATRYTNEELINGLKYKDVTMIKVDDLLQDILITGEWEKV